MKCLHVAILEGVRWRGGGKGKGERPKVSALSLGAPNCVLCVCVCVCVCVSVHPPHPPPAWYYRHRIMISVLGPMVCTSLERGTRKENGTRHGFIGTYSPGLHNCEVYRISVCFLQCRRHIHTGFGNWGFQFRVYIIWPTKHVRNT